MFEKIKINNLGTIPHRSIKMMKAVKESDTTHLLFIPLIPSDLCDRLKERITNEIGEHDYTCLFTVAYEIDAPNDEINVSTGFKVIYTENDEKKSHNIHIWLNQNDGYNEVLQLLRTLKPYIDKQLNTKNLLPE